MRSQRIEADAAMALTAHLPCAAPAKDASQKPASRSAGRIALLWTYLIFASVVPLTTSVMATPEETQAEIDRLKKEKEKLQAEKDLLDVQKGIADTRKALAALNEPPNTTLEELKNAKALADAKKEAATADFDAWKAQYLGGVSSASFSGAVELKEKAGQAEGALLAAAAVRTAAQRLGKAIAEGGQTKGITRFEVFAARDFANFQRLQAFRFQKQMIRHAFLAAGVVPDVAGPRIESVTPAMVSAGFDAFSKILSFFKTDYAIGGVATTIDEALLLYASCGALAAQGKEAYLATIYQPNAQGASLTALTQDLAELVALRAKAEAEADLLNKQADDLDKRAADPTNAAMKDQLSKSATSLKAKVAQLKSTITLFDNFAAALTTSAPKNGTAPLSALAQELAIETTLKQDKSAVLLLKLESTGGSYFTAKNIFTGLGSMPLYHMGGATVSYVVLAGPDGRTLAGDILPVHGGFVKAGNVKAELDKMAK